jgi:Cu/Ag efflux protein CusF
VSRFTLLLLLSVTIPTLAAEKSGRLVGTIIGRDAAANQLTVAHAEVPGIMGRMAMTYEVRGQKVASLPADGAKITATLHQDGGAYWLTEVKAAAGAEPSPPKEHAASVNADAPPGHDMHDMAMIADPTAALLMRQASGTSMNPAAAPMHVTATRRGGWMLMLHGAAFVDQVVQSGPRGDDKLFSTNWIMGMADRPLGGGHLMLRSMLSLEPLTVGKKYPELFQTGETIGGRPIVDAQHPHDFFMEVAAEYAHPLTATTVGYLYAAPFGDPALGPVAYPHRASASEIPQATLGHHLQDSTHIAGSVVTIGAQGGMFGYAVSGFHGREPDEDRWDIDTGKIDSWAARITFDPSPNWSAQVSTGHLQHPEAAEPGNVQRTTASVAYSRTTSRGQWDTSLIFGHNRKSAGLAASSWLAESVLRFGGRHYLTARGEIVDKDELFAGQDVPPALGHGILRVKALTIGYSRDLIEAHGIAGALGANATRYAIPATLEPYYGRNPRSLHLFVRLRGGGSGMHHGGM